MPFMLALNEIRRRACEFVLNWKEKASTAREEADAQTFETEFFNIFGVARNKMAIFEHKVKLFRLYRPFMEGLHLNRNEKSWQRLAKSLRTSKALCPSLSRCRTSKSNFD